MGNDTENSTDLPASPEADAIESQIPRISHFGNGSRIEVRKIEDGTVYFEFVPPGQETGLLFRRTIPKFIDQIAIATAAYGAAKDG